ncbi:MAG: hypothetical protein Salg2KO_11780 [Salibacteraceae bacterium]
MPVLAHDHGESVAIKYQENKGQWGKDLLFKGQTGALDVFVGHGKFMLGLKSRADFDRIHDQHHGLHVDDDSLSVHYHNIEFDLIGADPSKIYGGHETPDYVNYFLGDDPTKWAGGVRQFQEIVMRNAYPVIDFALSSIGNFVKYVFRLSAGADLNKIAFKINGEDSLYLDGNQLHINNSIAALVDNAPVAWQLVDGAKQFVRCAYQLNGDTLSFSVENHDSRFPLIIDPTLIFASYTGSTIDNWGSTATYDSLGNLYAGGIVVTQTTNGAGYPTVGAYQSTYQGGPNTGLKTDIVISKFNSAGSSLVYSTYLGGNNNEIPHSLIVNDNNELYVLGTTASNDFPVTGSAYDQTYNGGTNIPAGAGTGNSNFIPYNTGSDIIITKFSTNGAALLGSTYIGGTGNDGINQSIVLQHAYADEFRGEIIVDNNDNCYVATSTGSNDFPIVNGFQTVYGGGITDGVVFKLNSNLSSLLWSTYIGGNLDDGAYSVQFDPNLDVFATGGTTGGNFPTTAGVLNQSYMGGTADGWVAKISNNGQNLLASTFLGTNAYDQSFFVQLDLQGNVYTVGQTLGNYPIGPNWVYSNANSGQFLHKLTNNLQNTVFSTRWGSGNGAINLSLSAFLVNQCNHIFIAGWGGGPFTGSTTNGLTTTNNAVQTTTDGDDMYFIVFEDSATDILFGSYYGGVTATSIGGEHVDGGTSRFDKKGIIYQAVCAGCGPGNLPTTTGSVSTVNGSNNCNMGVIKYDLVTLIADADIDGPTQVCVNDSIAFTNSSFGGSLYLWDFGDGITSDEFEPMHAYSNPGNYTVTLIIYDSVSCIFADTDYIEVSVIPGPIASAPSVGKVCPDVPVQLSASGGQSYSWSPAAALDDPTSQNPIATVPISTIFVVTVTDSCGTDTAHIPVNVYPDKTDAQKDTALCRGLSGKLRAEGGLSYKWSPGTYLSSTTIAKPVCFPDSSIIYQVNIIDSFQCPREYKVKVAVEGFVPEIEAEGDTSICQGDRIVLTARGTDNYSWTPTETVLDPTLPTTPAFPEETTVFVVKTSNSCGSAYDTVRIEVLPIEVEAFADTAVCAGDSVTLGASGSLIYKWTGAEFERPNYNQFPSILPKESGWYHVTGSNIAKCEKVDSLYVTVHPLPFLDLKTNEDTITGLTNVLLIADSESPHRWFSTGYVPCTDCDSIKVYPRYETKYFVEVIDSNQCRVLDSISVEAISTIYIPKSFTPNGDDINDLFIVRGHNILDYEISIRNRWGEEIFKSRDLNRHWDGTKHNNGHPLGDGVYSYEIRYRVLPEQDQHETGTVTLLK